MPGEGVPLGPTLRRGWLGYQARIDRAMAEAGFDERRFPDGRVLRLCSEPGGVTVAHLGRQLGMTRQGASKVVADLRGRGYLHVEASATSGREKTVTLTDLARDYLATQRRAARAIEDELRADLGDEVFTQLGRLVVALDGDAQPRLRAYLQRHLADGGGLFEPGADTSAGADGDASADADASD